MKALGVQSPLRYMCGASEEGLDQWRLETGLQHRLLWVHAIRYMRYRQGLDQRVVVIGIIHAVMHAMAAVIQCSAVAK